MARSLRTLSCCKIPGHVVRRVPLHQYPRRRTSSVSDAQPMQPKQDLLVDCRLENGLRRQRGQFRVLDFRA